MNKKVEWGVLGVAEIAVKKVIPAMQRGECSEVTAIASRDLKKAQQMAKQLGIRKAYGSLSRNIFFRSHLPVVDQSSRAPA